VRVERQGYRVFRVRKEQTLAPRTTFTVHGDYSSAAFLLAAAVLVKSDVTITDLVPDCQGDRRIVNILRAMGAKISVGKNSLRVRGPFKLRGVDIDCADTPDLVPVLTMLACFARGVTRIRNIGHLAFKESDRLARPAGELRKLGANISLGKDSLLIRPARLHGGRVSACNDHRIAMALAVAGLRIRDGLTITGFECVAKSYPGFLTDMKRLGARMRETASKRI